MGYELIDIDDLDPLPDRSADGYEISDHYVPFREGEDDLAPASRGPQRLGFRVYFVDPGDELGSGRMHYHEEQEELFYVVDGTGHMLVGEDQDLVEIPEGGMIRPETTTPRQLRNESDDEVTWLAIGAPPVVEAQLWDAYDEDGAPAEDGEYRDLSEWL